MALKTCPWPACPPLMVKLRVGLGFFNDRRSRKAFRITPSSWKSEQYRTGLNFSTVKVYYALTNLPLLRRLFSFPFLEFLRRTHLRGPMEECEKHLHVSRFWRICRGLTFNKEVFVMGGDATGWDVRNRSGLWSTALSITRGLTSSCVSAQSVGLRKSVRCCLCIQ